MALSMTLFKAVLAQELSGQSLEVLGLMVALTLLLVALTVWMAREVLRPAEELERSRSEMTKAYDLAREDSLRDVLTGLGNHRAFQEELDRELEWYQPLSRPRGAAADRPGRLQARERLGRPRGGR